MIIRGLISIPARGTAQVRTTGEQSAKDHGANSPGIDRQGNRLDKSCAQVCRQCSVGPVARRDGPCGWQSGCRTPSSRWQPRYPIDSGIGCITPPGAVRRDRQPVARTAATIAARRDNSEFCPEDSPDSTCPGWQQGTVRTRARCTIEPQFLRC